MVYRFKCEFEKCSHCGEYCQKINNTFDGEVICQKCREKIKKEEVKTNDR